MIEKIKQSTTLNYNYFNKQRTFSNHTRYCIKDGTYDFSNILTITEKFRKRTIFKIIFYLVNAYFDEVDSEKHPNLNFTHLIQKFI